MQDKITINCDQPGIRLDKFLSFHLDNISRSQIQGLILSGKVEEENGIIITNSATKTKICSYLVDTNHIKTRSSELKPYDTPLDIVYEDEYLLVINKPAGLTVHPGAGNYDKTLANALIAYSQNLSTIAGTFRPGIVHRLDKDTSGLIIVAKDDETHNLLSHALSLREIKRYYLALVFGCPNILAGTIKTYVEKHRNDHSKMVVTRASGKEAITHYNVLKTFAKNNLSLLECKLDTGRTHQIRVQLHYKHLPVVGDQLYNEGQNKYINKLTLEHKLLIDSMKRQALHAYKLEFTHPITEEEMIFEIDLPEDMKKICQELE